MVYDSDMWGVDDILLSSIEYCMCNGVWNILDGIDIRECILVDVIILV